MPPLQVTSEDAKCRAFCDYYRQQAGQRGGALQYYAGHQGGRGIGAILASAARKLIPMIAPILKRGAKSLISGTMQGMDTGKGFGESLKGALAPTAEAMISRVGKSAKKPTKRRVIAKGRRQKGKGLAIPGKKRLPARRRVYKGKQTRVGKSSRFNRRTSPQFTNF